MEALGSDVNQAAKTNPQLEKAIQDLTQMVQAQRTEIINKNSQGINIKAHCRGSEAHPSGNFTRKCAKIARLVSLHPP